MLSSYAGSWALDSGGAGLFRLLAVMMTMVFLALAFVRRHVPRTAAATAYGGEHAPQKI